MKSLRFVYEFAECLEERRFAIGKIICMPTYLFATDEMQFMKMREFLEKTGCGETAVPVRVLEGGSVGFPSKRVS